ncbi:SusC/RagA family TonB-linked outer membrane protein [Lutibacter flavus]|uniref:TonB-linked outer membrane protein, SusC/RagA family n=1 Tax=Lutibacter flavus TaxID=691689 RepID=A0A238VAV2_9FLAO|nr:TonB-dependent receptor [Lutibacter flavus]SNR31264.1 TonB-linked outer membrane protein, SusC/RagA family [Lutibacter flavus]
MQKFNLKNIYYGTKQYYLLVLFCFVGQLMMAQSQVKGVVQDSGGLTLPGVNIIEKGTSNGVVTDFDGNFTISVQSNATLVFSYVGFDTQEILVSGRSIINVTLKENLESLDEVVVIGYGSQLKEDISGSVATVDTKALENVPQVGIDQLIQGRAAGVSVTLNSGQPGAAVSVKIRGVNSIQGSSEPLYVIDGIPVSGDSRNIGTSGRTAIDRNSEGQNGVSPLAAINPNDIESVNILKDASATAIYGSRGSNGVVIITTKKGKNQKGKLAYSTFFGIQQPTNIMDVLDLPGYARLQNEMGVIFGLNESIEFLRPELLGKGTNWQKEIFDIAYMKSHQLSFSGGSDGTNYYISGSHMDQEGVVIGSGFNRSSVRLNIESKINDKLRVGANITASRTDEKIIMNGYSRGIISLALQNNPALAVFNPDGSYAGPITPNEISLAVQNPIATVNSVSNKLLRDRIFANVFGEFKVVDGLTYRAEFGGDFGNNRNDRFQKTYSYGNISVDANGLNKRRENNDFWVIKNLLTYSKNFNDKHDLTVLAGHEVQESSWGGIVANAVGFVDNDVPTLGLSNTSGDTNDEYKGSTALVSYLSRAIYSFDNKYNVTASIRADGSSKFADGQKWGYFPSISASWKLSKEDFLKDFEHLQNIKIYGGYGEVGNQNIPNFAYGSRLNAVSTGTGTGFEVANFANPDLTWESSRQINFGVDFSAFDSRLNTTVELYKKISSDFLYQLALTSFVTGGIGTPGSIAAPWVNLGEMENKGIDVTLSYNTISNGDFSWNSTLTLSHYKNTVNELVGDYTINGSTSLDDTNQVLTRTRVGDPIGMFYGYQVEGIFRTMSDLETAPIQFGQAIGDNSVISRTWLGDVKFRDVNGDNMIDENDRTVIGNPHPDLTFGFQNTFRYKDFDFAMFIQGSYGNDVFNAIGRTLTATNLTYRNQLSSVLDYWSVANPNGTAPRFTSNSTPNINISDRYIEDGSYLRIQNVRLGYSLPSDIAKKAGMSKLKIYGSIQNLHTFTSYSGYDPEVGSLNQNALLMGVDNGRYPTPRTFTLGIDVEF